METPKKVVEAADRCFICATVVPKKHKLYIFGKSSIDFCEIINSALNVNVQNYSASDQLFICRAQCYQRLTKFKRAIDNLNKAKVELEEVFKVNVHRTKRLRCQEEEGEDIEKEMDGQLGQSASGKVVKVLNFSTDATTFTSSPGVSPFVSSDNQHCAWKFPSPNQSGGELLKCTFMNTIAHSHKVVTSTPRKSPRNCEGNGETSCVKLSISYPSKNVNKSLHGGYQLIGKALVHGIPSRVACAVMNCQPVRKHILEKTLGTLRREVLGLCSKNNPSLLRKSNKDGLTEFDLKRVCEEWKVRAPLFYSFLMISATNKRTKASSWFGSVAVAGSVLLKQRSEKMDATSSVLGIMLKTKSIEASISRLNKLKLTNSNSNILKKLDTLGKDHDARLTKTKQRITKENSILMDAKEKCDSMANSHSTHAACSASCQKEVDAARKEVDELKKACHPGFVISFDNIDVHVQRRNMTMDSQNHDFHWINHQMIENRVSGATLNSTEPKNYLPNVSNLQFIPTLEDQQRQRHNYIILTSRILVEYFQALSPLAEACIQHIPHKHSQAMSQKTKRTPLGLIFKNENVNEDMVEILKQFHSYLPQTDDQGVDGQFFSGDQLTVERAVNVIASVANGFTSKDRLEGINMQLGDWHAAVKLLSLIYSRFFSGKSSVDNCTMFADCALINRRNVTGDVSSSYRPNRDFFRVVFKSRVIGAAMSLLGFEDKSSTPSKYTLPKNMTALEKAAKLKVLHDLSAKVVDSFVFKDNVAEKVNNIISEHERRNVLNNQGLTPDGRFPCRFPGCKSSFKHNGKARRNHELAHNPPVQVENEPFQVSSTKPSPPSRPEEMKSKDDVFDYNCALLTDGYLFFNFLDAIKEGDGDRLIRQYKYFMLHCKADGTHSTKYALECLYQLFLVYALLTPRDSVRFVWNRSVNNHGKKACNIPLDESTEHSNNFIKQCIRNLGPNITEAAVSRVCKAESTTRLILENLDESLQRISRSGSHSESSEKKDLDELLKKVVSFQAFCEIEGRKYIHFKDFKRDGLENLDLSDLYQWINRHKRNVVLGIRSR